jgi:hypothetical protein
MLRHDRAARYLDIADIRDRWRGWGIMERLIIRRKTVHLAPGITKVIRLKSPSRGSWGRIQIDDGPRDQCRHTFRVAEFDPFQPFHPHQPMEIASTAEHTVGLVEQWRPREGTDAYRRWLWRATVDSAIRELDRDENGRRAYSSSHRLDLDAMRTADRGKLLRGEVLHLTFAELERCAERKAAPDLAIAKAFGLGASAAERTAYLYGDWHTIASALYPVNVPAAASEPVQEAERKVA